MQQPLHTALSDQVSADHTHEAFSNNYSCDERPYEPTKYGDICEFSALVFCRICDNHTKLLASVGLTPIT